MILKELCVAAMHPAEAKFSMCGVSERNSLQVAATNRSNEESGQGGWIQTSSPPQNQSLQLPNAMIVDQSIRHDPSISHLANRITERYLSLGSISTRSDANFWSK
jgi:hypothetical protein